MTPHRRLALRRYALYFLAWTAFGLFMFSQGMVQRLFEKDPNPWWHYLVSWLVGVYVWMLLTPAILWLGRRFPFERERWVRRLLTHLALAPAMALIQLTIESAILHRIGIFPAIMPTFAATFAFLLVIAFHQAFLLYWMLLAVQYGFLWYRKYVEGKQAALRLELRSAQLESQLTRAHLSALNMQLQPHFLFNTLNAIMVLVRQEKNREAEEMLGGLSDLLRCVLDDVDAQEVSLRRELEYVGLYLAIEQVRFQDRMSVAMAVDPDVMDAAVPHMVLQPIVENAIRHGIGGSSAAGKIGIGARRMNDALELKVQDDGPGLAAGNAGPTRGIGLTNTRARLQQLYGDTASLTVENAEEGGVTATIILPFRQAAGVPDPKQMEKDAVHDFAG